MDNLGAVREICRRLASYKRSRSESLEADDEDDFDYDAAIASLASRD